MAGFGQRSARQRLRRATQQALAVPAFRTPGDCTPWVLGGLWPAELTEVTPETATVAEYLKRDLQRIADSANHQLRVIHDAGLPEPSRLAEQRRVIDVARGFAVSRVESTVRQLNSRPPVLTPKVRETSTRPDVETAPVPVAPVHEQAGRRLQRLVDGLARQEPRLRWAVADRADGTTLVVTDLAEGWIPPGIEIPAGAVVLPPARRAGRLRNLLGDNAESVSYGPGDPFPRGRAAPAEGRGVLTAPTVDDLGWQLAEATRGRDGLPRITHTLARAAAAGAGVVEAEHDVLRVHLDTARYQLLARYPALEVTVLLNCLLLAATDALARGESTTANYHFAWFQVFSAPSSGNAEP